MTKWEYLTAPILTHAAKQVLRYLRRSGLRVVVRTASHRRCAVRRLLIEWR